MLNQPFLWCDSQCRWPSPRLNVPSSTRIGCDAPWWSSTPRPVSGRYARHSPLLSEHCDRLTNMHHRYSHTHTCFHTYINACIHTNISHTLICTHASYLLSHPCTAHVSYTSRYATLGALCPPCLLPLPWLHGCR